MRRSVQVQKRPNELFALTTMSLSALPNELIYFILSELAEPLAHSRMLSSCDVASAKRDLSSCALLSRRWTDAAQPLLFQDVAVTLQNENGTP